MYRVQISEPRLNKVRVITAADHYELQTKVDAQRRQWQELWERKVEAEKRKALRLEQALNKEQMIALAQDETNEAESAIKEAQRILAESLKQACALDWNLMKDRAPFRESKPTPPEKPIYPERPDPTRIPTKPDPADSKYRVKHNLMSFVLPGRKEREIEEAMGRYHADVEARKAAIKNYNEKATFHNQRIEQLNNDYHEKFANYQRQLRRWESRKGLFEENQAKQHQTINRMQLRYTNHDIDGIMEFCDAVLANSIYPNFCPREYDFDYIEETRTLIIDQQLPRIEDLPSRKSAKYTQSQNKISYTEISEAALGKLYEEVNYMIALRTLYEVFRADEAKAIESIVFNGIVDTIDKATGQRIRPCIMSIQVGHDEFLAINLAQVDPRACFRRLKGVSASKLQALQPVPPVAQLNREDSRFVDSREVAHTLDDSMNLASMDWEDFEHLIRELFGKEFGRDGGEVRVTQASRDGGVDAIAFDPDPIRGGKIVIQAKRYTNTVDVSAVRDLWGTIQHEGAMKGILVTTSHYGADAYSFAKGKPISLLDGGNLLHLLAKHGHKAKIDIKEARRVLSEGKK